MATVPANDNGQGKRSPRWAADTAVEDSDLPAPARAVMHCLLRRCHSSLDVGRFSHTEAEIARRTGLGERTVRKHLAMLVESGWIDCRQRGRCHWYTVVTPARGAAIKPDTGTRCRNAPARDAGAIDSPSTEEKKTAVQPDIIASLIDEDQHGVDTCLRHDQSQELNPAPIPPRTEWTCAHCHQPGEEADPDRVPAGFPIDELLSGICRRCAVEEDDRREATG